MPVLGGLLRKPKKEEKQPEQKSDSSSKTYLKAIPLRDLADLDNIKNEVKSGNILILRITPLASKSIEDVKRAVNELCEFAESINGDIARLGEERVVVCPQNVRIWREKTPVTSEPIPTAA
ncbi:MAG TPA: cell division protein SepF [Candidatus Bathyarchaeia archaeon]|nr:cell division protein SepF [Candidatus Bathyarchaeia archaeon]